MEEIKLFNLIFWLSRKIRGIFLLRVMYGCDIPRKAMIGKHVTFSHRGLGTVVSSMAVSDDNVYIQHNVTIGTKDGKTAPVIYKNVFIGPYAMILRDVEIGEGATIGAGTLVLESIPPHTVYVNKRELTQIG